MEDKITCDDPCLKCGEIASSFKVSLDTICNHCAEEEGTNIKVEVIRTCLSCNTSFPVDYITLELAEHINSHLKGMEVINGPTE